MSELVTELTKEGVILLNKTVLSIVLKALYKDTASAKKSPLTVLQSSASCIPKPIITMSASRSKAS